MKLSLPLATLATFPSLFPLDAGTTSNERRKLPASKGRCLTIGEAGS